MVSALWKACSEGNLEDALELLREASTVEIEIKDHTGVTPLIEAVKIGHVEVVRALLEKGADPTNASSQGPPEQYTTDPIILDLLNTAKSKVSPDVIIIEETACTHDPNMDPTTGYYGPPPSAYYYPGMPVPPHILPDGTPYYATPPPVPTEQNPNGIPNLPPPEVARMIPCRYYPACRYGTSCMFAHPQTPYIQGPLPPPAQYPTHYDTMTAPYPPHSYYPVQSPSFQGSPNGVAISAMSPPHGPHPLPHIPMGHARSGSEIVSPVQAHFSPTGTAPPMPYGIMSPISPTYGHPGQMPVPISIPPLPPLQHSAAGGPQSPQHAMYPPISPGAVPPYAIPGQHVGQYVPQSMHMQGAAPEAPNSPPVHPQADGYGPPQGHREGMTHHRRGSARRPSFGGPGRKPACLFFPAGRCRNGDECRFPHVLPDGAAPHHPPHYSARGGHRPRGPPHAHPNGSATIEEKFSAMAVQDDRQSSHSRTATNGTSGTGPSSRSQSTEPGSKGRVAQAFKHNHLPNGVRLEKKVIPPRPQRLPSADEFPVLASATPPLRSPPLNASGSSGYTGPTAAQVLLAPPPSRKDAQPDVRGSTPEHDSSTPGAKDKTEVNSVAPAQEQIVNKLTVSFAAAATAAPDAPKEVSVTA
ncbi:predicted protein [Sparassis crispa]|uniref:C3H1-type domain-containing protein n=1 Tax=Sparassis crispa TaxID=139825 RepID=A0A401G6L7_9APHY|nr:predicted protein [Sparassis crispa]GBE77794.1 predicted protein [Sparassis crispa]